ncbi:hypothetical protein [Providencia phage PSTRCR_114]|uniref:Uncharacterized protein n=1 Tax=Providencia phage PSTRCR_114 TaxID=2800824 RepID=A0A7T6ZM69_9CAUD|nr:hypothetical protein [Providencia phage PSTRCR_114]
MATLHKQMNMLRCLSLDLDVDSGSYHSAYNSLGLFSKLYGIDLDKVKEDLLKVSDIQGAVKTIQEKPTQEVDLIILHNTYVHLTALSGCIYTKPEDFDPVHTLACINDCLVFILVMQELHDC